MSDQAPNIDVKPGDKGRLVYDKERRTIVAQDWECAARKQGTAGGNDPTDCDWPCCRCDPYANKVLDALDEAGFELTKKRAPLPWDAYSNRSYGPVERRAAEIYETFPFPYPGQQKPAWTPGGNGTKQDEARSLAREELRAAEKHR